jgi:hypothetical protein
VFEHALGNALHLYSLNGREVEMAGGAVALYFSRLGTPLYAHERNALITVATAIARIKGGISLAHTRKSAPALIICSSSR